MTKPVIRNAYNPDLSKINAWVQQLVEHVKTTRDVYVNAMSDEYIGEYAEWFSQAIFDRDVIVLIAEIDQISVGFLQGKIEQPFIASSQIQTIGHIEMCWVDIEYRRDGIAQALVAEAESWFRRKQVSYVDVNYIVGNQQAETAWPNMGYTTYRLSARKCLDADD